MSTLPAGTVTFLYTDIEGSSRLWEHQPEAMRRALVCHDAILHQAIESQGGTIFRTAGDAICAAFSSAEEGLSAALQAQQALVAQDWQADGIGLASPLCVRVALHSAAAEVQNGDYVGGSLNRIGRLLPVCHGGQILLTQATEQLGRDHLPVGARLLDLGQHRFRDLVYPERVFQLIAPGLPELFPPLKTLDSTPNNLPLQLTSFVGREDEIVDCCNFLSANRLLTLTGPGGTGKTRLSLQVAANLLGSFSDGAWLVELAPLADPALVPQAIASALSLREKMGMTLMDVLIEHLCAHKNLLVLDNCEHLIEASAQITDRLLRHCPDLKILVSSREALGIAGEVSYRVPPLALPETQVKPDIEALRKVEAVRLFVERAQAVKTQFTLSSQNATAVTQICRRLDGIPLALELAAARIKLFSAEQIAARLDDRFMLLTGGSRTALPRQQTLQALIDWSHDLLSEKEKALFRRLSVFAGGWSYEAAESICLRLSENDLVIAPPELLDLLSQLVNKSLVLADEQGEEARYYFLETVRQYASQKLFEAGEAARVRAKHLDFYAAQAGESRSIRYRVFLEHSNWSDWVEREQANLRLALDWGLEHDPAKALRIGQFAPFSTQSGLGSEFLRSLRQVRQRFLSLQEYQGELSPEHQALLGESWVAEGGLLEGLGENALAIEALKTGLEYARKIQSSELVATADGLLVILYGIDGNFNQEVLEVIEEGIPIAQRLNEPDLLSLFSMFRARITLAVSGYPATRAELLRTMAEASQGEDSYAVAMICLTLAYIAYISREFPDALQYFTQSNALFTKYNDRQFMNITRGGLADIALQRGDFEQAESIYLEVLKMWVMIGNRGAVARMLECLAAVAIGRAKESSSNQSALLQRSVNLFGAAETLRKVSNSDMTGQEKPEYEAWLEELRQSLTPDQFSTAWAAGSRLSQAQAVDFAGQLGSLNP
jgi:predicted ATPase/class 3 adenylate cyclase